MGSSYLPSDIQAAYLYGQLEKADMINNERLASWYLYEEHLQELDNLNKIQVASIPDDCIHNAHMFYIKTKNIKERSELIEYLKVHNIMSVFHYIPLHSSPAGKYFGALNGSDSYTTKESENLLRLPMYHGLTETEVKSVTDCIISFYSSTL